MEGWIKLHRNILNWRWATSSNHFALFTTLLLRANYKETKWRKVDLKPGQLVTGRKQLSSWTGLSEMQIRTALADLVTSGEINQQITNKFSIITISNWEKYQVDNQQITNKQPADNQQITTSKNVNNIITNNGVTCVEPFTPDFFEGVIEDPKKILPQVKSSRKRKTTDNPPLSALFTDKADTIHDWLKTGNATVQEYLLKTYSHHVLAEEVRNAFIWQLTRKPRQADRFLSTWLKNSNKAVYGANNPTDQATVAREFYKSKFGHYPVEIDDEKQGA